MQEDQEKIKQKEARDLEEIKDFYDSVYYRDRHIRPPRRHEVNLAKQMQVNRASRVLDVACGTGEWLLACQQLGAKVAGVDLSEKAIEICKEQMSAGEFYAQAAESLPFAENSFDLVTCLGSLEHFVNPVQALTEMRRVATDQARFILLVPNADFLTRKLGLFSGTYQVDAKEVVRTLEEWQDIFNQAGLTVKRRWKDLHILNWEWICKGRWFQIPLRIAQALALPLWPLRWQYQVYHLCEKSD
ncbi:MAG: SAM-dependent methyltransferase [Gammaproteobacteria bacterium]|nr:SAM-dependent methyltransferase [Gammaproteobacteria bacterium]|tara:strand:- start:389081 stop:389812 length:732 start_codon:yes stop_codon:yes gene_type:complete